MGDISECMVIIPSNGRSGGGFTIFASTWAITLQEIGIGRGIDALRPRTAFCQARIRPSQVLDQN
jgi:hypothetical protein